MNENTNPWRYGMFGGGYHYWFRLDGTDTVWNCTPKGDPDSPDYGTPPPLNAGGYKDRRALQRLKGEENVAKS